jgi:hypothetical protein
MSGQIGRTLAASVTCLLVLSQAVPARPAAPCFQPADIEADQAIRYQTQIMVLSDACGTDTYRDFTVHNREAIAEYDKQMMAHYRRVGERNPQSSLDSFLTRIANEMSLSNGAELAQSLCGRTAPVLAEAETFTVVQFRQRATQLAQTNSASYRRCGR